MRQSVHVPAVAAPSLLRRRGFIAALVAGGIAGGWAPAFGATSDDEPFRLIRELVWDTGPGSTGASPFAGLSLGSDGDLYGTAVYAGPGANGSVFRLRPRDRFRAIVGYVGESPTARVTEGLDGALYGTDMYGGEFTGGSVFRVDPTTHAYSVLHSFSGLGSDGRIAQSALALAPDGSFYGTTTQGGDFGAGTVFRVGTDGSFATLHSFAGPADCSAPWNDLVLAGDGLLYGTCSGDSSGNGAVWRLAPDGGGFTLLHHFTAEEGHDPTGLVQARDGSFYGSNYGGGAAIGGVVYRMTAQGSVTVLHTFDCATDGCGVRPVIEASDGNLYGTTSGPTVPVVAATVFALARDGSGFTVLHVFDGSDGSLPTSRLVEAPDGRLYGTTSDGGAAGAGVLFSVAKLSQAARPGGPRR